MRRIWDWMGRNSDALQGLGALLTAVVAAVALVGVKLQIDASANQAEAQSAREIYRGFLSLSLSNPDLADPGRCPAFDDRQTTQYEAYLEYMFYTAEQVTKMDPEWDGVFAEVFERHADVICESADWGGYSPSVEAVILETRTTVCPKLSACPVAAE